MDADDYFLANRFEVEKQVFASNPDADGVYGALGTLFYNENGQEIEVSEPNGKKITTTSRKIPPSKLFEHLIGIRKCGKGYFSIVTLSLKAQAIKDTAIGFNETLRLHQDSDFIWKLSYYLNLFPGEVEKPIAIRGVHQNNRYNSKSDNTSSFRLLFQTAVKWAESSGLHRKYILHFKMKYHFVLFKHVSIKTIPRVVKELIEESDKVKLVGYFFLFLIRKFKTQLLP